MRKTLWLLTVLVILGVVSCNDEASDDSGPSGLIYSYFPVNVGHELIYDVVHITKSSFDGSHDTAIYQLKEVIESQYIDGEGRTTQRLERYSRNTSGDPWVIKDVWTSNLTPARVEKKEENNTYIKLVFPINGNVEWNGNILNNMDAQMYEYYDLHEPLDVGGISFDSTLSVLEAEDNFYDENKYESETYAPGVGLIYREKNFIKWYKAGQAQFDTIISQDLYKETIVSWSN